MKSTSDPTATTPRYAPVMFLPSVMLPHVLMPLFIFEPRYRAMLTHCLEKNRMFCVALLRPGVTEASGPADYFPVAGLGLVRACVRHDDGTSHLILQGVSRVELGKYIQEQPFRIAELRELPTTNASGTEIDGLVEKVREKCSEMLPSDGADREKLKEQIAQLTDPGAFADVVAHTLLRNPYRQQEVLEQLFVPERLSSLLRHLRAEMAE